MYLAQRIDPEFSDRFETPSPYLPTTATSAARILV
jgi:hypothetical protein